MALAGLIYWRSEHAASGKIGYTRRSKAGQTLGEVASLGTFELRFQLIWISNALLFTSCQDGAAQAFRLSELPRRNPCKNIQGAKTPKLSGQNHCPHRKQFFA